MTKLKGKVWIDDRGDVKFMRAEVDGVQYAHIYLLTELYHISLEMAIRDVRQVAPDCELTDINGLNGFVPVPILKSVIVGLSTRSVRHRAAYITALHLGLGL